MEQRDLQNVYERGEMMDTRVFFDIYTGVLSWQKSQHPLGHLSI